jgi:hypothetical protein
LSEDDEDGHTKSLYFEGVPLPGYPSPDLIEWQRPSEFCDSGDTPKFLKGDASSNEVKQGALGDCWFIGALSVIATRDELLRGAADKIPPEFKKIID